MTAHDFWRTAMLNRKTAALVVLLGVGFALLPAAPASADRRAVVRVDSETPVVVREPGIPRGVPITAAGSVDPDQCNTSVFCDTIPFQVVPPARSGASDDIQLEIVVAWKDPSQLDGWLWDNKQTKAQNGKRDPADTSHTYTAEDASDYTVIDKQSGRSPRFKVVVKEPTFVDYNLTVLNYSGANTGYTITAKFVIDRFAPVAESLEDPLEATDDSFVSSSDLEATGSVAPSSSLVAPSAMTVDTIGDTPSGHSLDVVDLGGDALLGSIQGSDLNGLLAAPAFAVNAAALQGPVKPPSGIAVLFWAAVLPVFALAGTGGLFVRRRRAASAVG
jgi:hypothetical protein